MNMQAQDIREKKGHRSLVIGHWLRIFLIFILFTTYHLSPITHYPLSVFAQQPVQQKSFEEERLNIIRADIQKKIEQLEKLKIEIDAAQKALQKARDEELLKIAKIYEAMPPEEAARKLEALSEDMAVLILISLKPRTAGRVMAQMDTEKAASISKKMLERATEKTSR